jgi:hypothetical protein
VVVVPTIPPCTILTVDAELLEEVVFNPSLYPEFVETYWNHIEFTDVHGDWSMTQGAGPTELPPDRYEVGDGEYTLDETVAVARPASDCGSG